jgi:hypothetical protein
VELFAANMNLELACIFILLRHDIFHNQSGRKEKNRVWAILYANKQEALVACAQLS